MLALMGLLSLKLKDFVTQTFLRLLLKKGSPINFNEFSVNKCVGTMFHGITIVIDSIANNPDTFNLLVLRSFGESFYHHITDSALEYGYVGV